MKQIILGITFCCSVFHCSYSMDGTFASFKDAVLGKKRDLQEEIKTVQTDTSLTPAIRARQLAKLYSELRNKFRGKEEYAEYNHLMCRYTELAQELEDREQECARKFAEQEARNIEEASLNEQLAVLKTDKNIPKLEKYQSQLMRYVQLKYLFEGINKEKYDLYEAQRADTEQKIQIISLKKSLEQEANKTKKAEMLREMSSLCTKKDRAQSFTAQAEALDEEVIQEEKQQKYHEILEMISQNTDLAQRAKLYRVLMYYCEEKAEENLMIAQKLEAQVKIEQAKQEVIINKTFFVSSISIEIDTAEQNTKVSRFNYIDTLAGLLEKRAALTKGIAPLESKYPNDLARARKLRTESITLAPTEATKLAIMRSLQQP